ncbi:hypothetical protein [Chryseobacterium bernardetii]|uniref:hypothetical protein n=1 Tax=Chryseobacterium bernardetii TaxID=1241978 RepID=UPI003AF70641
MIKDRNLKIKAIEYFTRRFWYPHLEVNVLSKNQLSRAPKLVTDIDAIALAPEVTGTFFTILGDCKTLKGQSPITRALWMKGLMEYFSAEKGLILLSKEVEKEHQLTANVLDIQLFSEEDFEFYSKSTADYIIDINSALIMIDHWDLFMDIDKRHPKLKPLADFARTGFWNEKNNNNYLLRTGLSILKSLKAELNPANNLHLALVLHHYSLIAISLNQIVIQIFTKYVSLKSKDELSNDLKIILYGGIDNYEFLNDLRKRYIGAYAADKNLSLPEWESFVELIRLFFQNPLGFNALPLYLKELSFCFLSSNPENYTFSKTIASKDRYTSNFAIRLCEYLNKACDLPPEFVEIYSEIIVFNKFNLKE